MTKWFAMRHLVVTKKDEWDGLLEYAAKTQWADEISEGVREVRDNYRDWAREEYDEEVARSGRVVSQVDASRPEGSCRAFRTGKLDCPGTDDNGPPLGLPQWKARGFPSKETRNRKTIPESPPDRFHKAAQGDCGRRLLPPMEPGGVGAGFRPTGFGVRAAGWTRGSGVQVRGWHRRLSGARSSPGEGRWWERRSPGRAELDTSLGFVRLDTHTTKGKRHNPLWIMAL